MDGQMIIIHAGILEVLHCILIESPEALNLIAEGHIKSIISLLDKHGRNHKVGMEERPLPLVYFPAFSFPHTDTHSVLLEEWCVVS
jgi:hypothetical protein